MGNMNYCRFRNTLNDLHDCYKDMDECEDDEEERARKRIIKLCKQIADEYAEED